MKKGGEGDHQSRKALAWTLPPQFGSHVVGQTSHWAVTSKGRASATVQGLPGAAQMSRELGHVVAWGEGRCPGGVCVHYGARNSDGLLEERSHITNMVNPGTDS